MRAYRRIHQDTPAKSRRDDKEQRQPLRTQDIVEATGTPLDLGTRHFLEPRLGHDLSTVRIVTDAGADSAARALNARAFTTGDQIFFRSGEFNPQSDQGMHLLAHETAHTIQQRRGEVVQPPGDALHVSDPSDDSEREADRRADDVMRADGASVGPAMAPTIGTASSSAGLIQRQVADTKGADVSSFEPGEDNIISGPGRPGQIPVQAFLHRLQESLTKIAIELLGKTPGLQEAISPDLLTSTMDELMELYGRESTKSPELLEELLRREYPEEYKRQRVDRFGPDRQQVVFTGSADLLLKAIENKARMRFEKAIEERLRAHRENKELGLGSEGDSGKGLESPEGSYPQAGEAGLMNRAIVCQVVMEFWLGDGAVNDPRSKRFFVGMK